MSSTSVMFVVFKSTTKFSCDVILIVIVHLIFITFVVAMYEYLWSES